MREKSLKEITRTGQPVRKKIKEMIKKKSHKTFCELYRSQYDDIKKKYPDAILLFRNGDFYSAYFDDAEKVSAIIGITVHRKKMNNTINLKTFIHADFPHYALDFYLPKIVRSGERVLFVTQ